MQSREEQLDSLIHVINRYLAPSMTLGPDGSRVRKTPIAVPESEVPAYIKNKIEENISLIQTAEDFARLYRVSGLPSIKHDVMEMFRGQLPDMVTNGAELEELLDSCGNGEQQKQLLSCIGSAKLVELGASEAIDPMVLHEGVVLNDYLKATPGASK